MEARARGTRALGFSLAVGFVGLVGPASAGAASQFGQTFPATENCSNGQTLLQATAPNGQYSAPSSGVITSWSYDAPAFDLPRLKLKVARPAGGNSFTIVGEEGPRTPVASTFNTYQAQISVQPGDVLGVYVDAFGGCGRFAASGTGYYAHAVAADPAPGTTAVVPPTYNNFQLDVSATLEPDCDSDGSGDETQDPELTGPNCPPPPQGNRSLTLDANKNKVKRGKKVLLSGRLTTAGGQGPCDAGQTVELQRKRPKQPAFATFAQVQSDAQGGFSLKLKLKKTFEFRAQLLETAACTAALSNSERGRVKKKRR